jgi:hypothetical protein
MAVARQHTIANSILACRPFSEEHLQCVCGSLSKYFLSHHRTYNRHTMCFASYIWILNRFIVSIMPQPCYRLGLPFLALILAASAVGEHLVTASVAEFVNYPAAFSCTSFCSLFRSTALRASLWLRCLRNSFFCTYFASTALDRLTVIL